MLRKKRPDYQKEFETRRGPALSEQLTAGGTEHILPSENEYQYEGIYAQANLCGEILNEGVPDDRADEPA